MTGSAADTAVAAAAAADGPSPVSPPTHHQPETQLKPLKGLLKSAPSSGEKSKKRVQFSETLLVFCDDWPDELMPQIIALKSPSDFSLVEVAAQGYMFEPPVEYQDCMSFDPPPDYRDLNRADAATGGSDSDPHESQDAFAFIDAPAGNFAPSLSRDLTDACAAPDSSMYWQSVILNEKENLEEDAIIGVLKEDAILQAIGARHSSSMFQPPVTDVLLSQADFPIHYSEQQPQSGMSPASSTSSLQEGNQRSEGQAAEAADDLLSAPSPSGSIQDPASDSSFTSQDTIIVMTKEILRGRMSPFADNADEDLLCPDHLPRDSNSRLSVDEDHGRSCTPASDDSASIGRFRVVSCSEGQSPVPAAEPSIPASVTSAVRVDDSHTSDELSEEITTAETQVPPDPEPKEPGPRPLSVSSDSPIDANIGRFHVVNYSQELSIEPVSPVVSEAAKAACAPKKRAPPPPPPAKPCAALLKQRMSAIVQGSTDNAPPKVTESPVISQASVAAPTRSGSVPNALVSVSEIRKAFERRGASLDDSAAVPSSAAEFVCVTRDQRPKSFPSDSLRISESIDLSPFSSLPSHRPLPRPPQNVPQPDSNLKPLNEPSLETKAKSAPTDNVPAVGPRSSSKSTPAEHASAAELVEYTQEPRALIPSKRTSSLANFQTPAVVRTHPSVARVLHQQPVYLSLDRRHQHQLLSLSHSHNKHVSGVATLQPPVRTSSVPTSCDAAPPPLPNRPSARTQVFVATGDAGQQFVQSSAGLVSPNAIYGYIRNCSVQSSSGNLIHYHHPQYVLQSASQKLSSNEDFPNASEIRRRDGINAFPHVWQETPTPGKFHVAPFAPVSEQTDELEQFVQQEQDRTERMKQRYGLNEAEDKSDDPTFGFGKRPAVRGIRSHHPDPQPRQTRPQPRPIFVQSLGPRGPQVMGHQTLQPSTGLRMVAAYQQPPPPSRHVYLVRAPNYNTLLPLASVLSRNLQPCQGTHSPDSRTSTLAATAPVSERPVSSLGQNQMSAEGFSSGCAQCLLAKQRRDVERRPEPAPVATQAANSLLSYKTISMPNVAMIRPVGLLSMVPAVQRQERSHAVDPALAPRTPVSNSTASAGMAVTNVQMQNNNPDLVIDVTSRTSGPKGAQVAASSPMASASSMPRAKKDAKKEERKKSKKDKKKQTKEGHIYYSMNV